MKNIGKIFKENIKVIVAFVIGGIVFGGVGVVIAGDILASNVKYTKNSQTTVDGALDTLYTRSSKWVNPNDMGTPLAYAYGTYKGWCTNTDTNCSSLPIGNGNGEASTTPPSGKNVYLGIYPQDGQFGVCIKRNGKEHCFRARNYIAEIRHMTEVFSDITCYSIASSGKVNCDASDFRCFVDPGGSVHCTDLGTGSFCGVIHDGSMHCS